MMPSSASKTGVLYIVATPIGHLDDISMRAIRTLQSVDTILSEDTRHSQQLLNHLGIKKPLISFHAHNEAIKTQSMVEAMLNGQSFALISDAGTPLISDPGYPLVLAARQANISVVPIPGPCALVTALSAAGVPCDTVSFFGFLPAKPKARREKLTTLLNIHHTLVFYESTHRIHACLEDISTVFGDACEVVLAKELTKTFERFVHGPISTIKAWLEADAVHAKGEFVVIIAPRELIQPLSEGERVLELLLKELPLKQAVNLAAAISKDSKNELYQLALTKQEKR
ncbi:MAG: 16S rRNA (cytidine(1402)-2'-O)-methyltransferase [Legionella sp.]|nr:MAG: 16S rRNA (cytidine(1402)-2'-O)-methyltransferase [Legionella sp.]